MRRSRKTYCGINEELYESHLDYLLANFSKEEAENCNLGRGQVSIVDRFGFVTTILMNLHMAIETNLKDGVPIDPDNMSQQD